MAIETNVKAAAVRHMISCIPPNNARNEAAWVVCAGTKKGERVYVLRPDHGTYTTDLDKAHGWRYKEDALAEERIVARRAEGSTVTDDMGFENVGRRASFRPRRS